MMHPALAAQRGFTLIEMAIVLVIIGLVVGGVLVGQDLIRAAAVRATISQIEKYNTAVNTFRGKFNALPGDVPAALVAQLGFVVTPARAGTGGQGDGNGVIEGNDGPVNDNLTNGETAWFWEDLSSNSSLIEGAFNTATATPNITLAYSYLPSGTHTISSIIPESKLGLGTYIYVYANSGVNYYGLSGVTSIDGNGAVYSSPGVSVAQAYAIDKKVDDGLPQSGHVTAQYENWALLCKRTLFPVLYITG